MALLLILVVIFSYAQAETVSYTQFSRYLTAQNTTTSSQRDVLSAVIKTVFPSSVSSVGSAIAYELRGSGYRVLEGRENAPSVRSLYRDPLPEMDRVLGLVSIRDALLTLAGPAYQLVVDPVHRLITFRLRPSYRVL